MSDLCLIEKDTLDKIGNAIRSRTGKTDKIAPQNMPDEIEKMGGCSLKPYVISPLSDKLILIQPLMFTVNNLLSESLTIEKEE